MSTAPKLPGKPVVVLTPEEAEAHALVIQFARHLSYSAPPRYSNGLHDWLGLRRAVRALNKIEGDDHGDTG